MRNNAPGVGGCSAAWRDPHACVCMCVYVYMYVFVHVGDGIYSHFAHVFGRLLDALVLFWWRGGGHIRPPLEVCPITTHTV